MAFADDSPQAQGQCNGERPCLRCKTKNIRCDYTFKKRCGPKRRKGLDVNRGEGEGLLASCKSPTLHFDDHLRGMAVVLGKDEVECVRVFMQNLNTILPMTTIEAVKLAATPTLSDQGGASSGANDKQDEEEANQLHHARKAVLHGAIAVGAEILEKEEPSITHAGIARQEIKECFDAAVPELVGAYLILALYWIHQNDSSKIARYVGLAHQSNGIIREPPGELVASLQLISVILYDAKVLSNVGCRVMPPGPPEEPAGASLKTAVARQERVLRILSFVLLAIRDHAAPSADPTMSTGPWDPDALSKSVDEAKLLLEKFAVAGHNEMSKCIVLVLQAYFVLLLKNDRTRAVVITEPLADLTGDDPTLLRLPIVWSMVGCVRALLEGANRTIAVERLQSTMEPLASHVGFSSDESLIEKELMKVFREKEDDKAPVEPLPVLDQASMFFRPKAQTSSLNVTAGDYSALGRCGVDLLSLQPSEAPRRRGLPGSSTKKQIAPGEGGHLGNAITPSGSLLSVSPAPASRAGALIRTPRVRRDSLSITAPIERPSASLLHLDLSLQVPEREFLEAVPAGVVPIPPTSDFMLPGVSTNGMTIEVKPDAEANGDDAGGVADSFLEVSNKLEADRGELMIRQKIQPSFKADAPVSLEQVESNMAKLGVSTGEGDALVDRIMTQMDVEVAAELIATKTGLMA